MNHTILTLNGGSSTLRFAVYDAHGPLAVRLCGKVELCGGALTLTDGAAAAGDVQQLRGLEGDNGDAVVDGALDWMQTQPWFADITGIGHRVVHGMQHTEPELIDAKLMDELHQLVSFAPQHLPRELALIGALLQRVPGVPQIACFDTAFHHGLPQVAKMLAIPRRYLTAGVRRYGFHGLSYAYCMSELQRLEDPAALRGRVILAHLGNGASLAAVRNGRSIDTSMALTANAGVPMSSRSGDLDPGLGFYLQQTEQMTAAQFHHMVCNESGLLGISGTSSDMRELLAREGSDRRAGEAIALFCYQVKKWIGSFAAALGGLDTLVFTGGIGANAPLVRARICAGLAFLGIELDEVRNAQSAALISADIGRATVRVVHTDEELMIARGVMYCLAAP